METKQKITPSILPGFMELLPKDQVGFNKMLKVIQETYELFGFVPIDTPIIEKAEVLMAKGGEETEKQTYTLKKGDNDLALRFDLTVPLARYVSEHFNDLVFPFKRYQIGKVYRGEKPQRGRYRELYQCDVDIIGRETLDLVNDAELVVVINDLFKKIDVGEFVVKISNRKIMNGVIDYLGYSNQMASIMKLIDKFDKIGLETFKLSLKDLSLSDEKIDELVSIMEVKGNNLEVILKLKALKVKNEEFEKGLLELETVINYLISFNLPNNVWTVDLSIVRGLDYYTGTVYETFLVKYPQIGSVCSGGRYDNLAEYYTDQKLPGVGVSVGLTRLFFQLQENGLVKEFTNSATKILVISLLEDMTYPFEVISLLRKNGIASELYTGPTSNIKKKFEYANKTGVPYVAVIGDDELQKETVTVKDMTTGEQSVVKKADLLTLTYLK